jgi:hypothetical protein
MSSSLGRSLLACVIALGLSAPAFAQPKADPGSGPTNGAVSTNDAGSGPTKGLSQTQLDLRQQFQQFRRKQRRRHPGPKSTGGSQPVTPAMPEKKQ